MKNNRSEISLKTRQKAVITTAIVVATLAAAEIALLINHLETREKNLQLMLMRQAVSRMATQIDTLSQSQAGIVKTTPAPISSKAEREAELAANTLPDQNLPMIPSKASANARLEPVDLSHLVRVANILGGESRVRVINLSGKEALHYNGLDIGIDDPFWQIINLLNNAKRLSRIDLVGGKNDSADREALTNELIGLGVDSSKIHLQENDRVFKGLNGMIVELSSG